MAIKGKRLKKANESIDRNALYELGDAVKILKANATTKFDETVEIAINLGVDPRHADQMVRGVVSLPHGNGKSLRVAVFAKGDKVKEAEDAGADFVGAENLSEKIKKGEIDFDRCIATPDMMAVVGQLGKVLGPKGLMPNPKLGTVNMDVTKAVGAIKSGQIEVRGDKGGVIHAPVGRRSFDAAKLNENLESLLAELNRLRPSSSKGRYMQKMSISSTMGAAVRVDETTL